MAGINGKIDVYHLGFVLGPRINSGGRIGNSKLGSTLLSTENKLEAQGIAHELDNLNRERQAVEKIALEEALKQAKSGPCANFVIASGNWHPGVIGTVAGRLKEIYNLPSIVISENSETSICKASLRSVPALDIGALVLEAKLEGVVLEGGGHKAAAGFSILSDKIETLKEFVRKKVSDIDTHHSLKADGILSVKSMTSNFVESIEKLSPFGMGNPEPKFIVRNVSIYSAKLVKSEHVSCIISQGDKVIHAMAFRAVELGISDYLLNNPRSISLLGKVKSKSWNGTRVQFMVEDVAVSD